MPGPAPVAPLVHEIDLASLGEPAHETHGSRVYLAGDRAFKVRKSVQFPFLDQSTPDLRRRLALAELTLNRALAPGRYLGIRTVANTDGREVAVEMRRFSDDDTLAARLHTGRVDGAMLQQLGQRVAQFHRSAAPECVEDPVERALQRLHRATEGWLGARCQGSAIDDIWHLVRPVEAALVRRAGDLERRAAQGRWREGHGDLRADHVVVDARGLAVVDRLEFDRDLRVNDVGDDLAFLLMDLRSRGAAREARAVLAAYRAAGGDPGDDELVAIWSSYRAIVSLQVAALRSAQPGAQPAPERHAQLVAAARALTWRCRGAGAIVVCGPPATGKSTLSAELARRADFPLLSSDVVRKSGLGLIPTERADETAYSASQSRSVYRELGRLAAEAVAEEAGCIVDATMGSAALRQQFLDALGPAARVTFVECRVPGAEADRRAHARLADPSRISDATPDVARRLRGAFEPLDEVPAARHLLCRTDQPTGDSVDELERRLD